MNFFEVPAGGILPFIDATFDTIICNFALHRRGPSDKAVLMTALASAIRTGGILHVVELDRPSEQREAKMLGFAALLWGTEAVASHLDESWRKYLSQAGFQETGLARSFSVVAGRITVVTARRKKDKKTVRSKGSGG